MNLTLDPSSKNLSGAAIYSLLLVTLLLGGWGPVQAGYLFRASPGYEGVRAAGLWGGEINHPQLGEAENLFSIGYQEIDMPTSYIYEGMNINSLSYDPVTRDTLVEVVDTLEGVSVVGRGQICPPLSTLPGQSGHLPLRTVIPDVVLVDNDHPFLFDPECGWKCGWGAFSLFNDQVYFVLTGVHGLRSTTLRRKVQIRVLNSNCDAILSDAVHHGKVGTDFMVLNCSDLVATVIDVPYTRPNPVLDTWVASPLKVVQTHVGRPLCFYLQLMKKADCDVSMNLVQVCEDRREPVFVHSATLPSIYGGNTGIRGFGSIDYRDGMLCWSAAEELLCGPIAEERVSLVSILLPPGAAVDAGICTGDLPLSKVISGVTVAQAVPLRVYFGCYSQLAGDGGTGLVVINVSSTSEIVKNIYPVTSDKRKVYASSLFYVDSLCGSCSGSACLPSHTTREVDAPRTAPSIHSGGVTPSPTRPFTTLIWVDGGGGPVDGALTGSAWTLMGTFLTVLSLLGNTAFVLLIIYK